jgi:hypothetical protein
MLELGSMSSAVNDEIQRFLTMETDDPRLQASQQRMLESLLRIHPEVQEKVAAEARVAEARAALCRVLARRKLAATEEDEARIASCTDLATLERWHDQAIDAPSAAEALR